MSNSKALRKAVRARLLEDTGKVDEGASVFLSAALHHVITQVLGSAKRNTQCASSEHAAAAPTRIEPQDIQAAVRDSADLRHLASSSASASGRELLEGENQGQGDSGHSAEAAAASPPRAVAQPEAATSGAARSYNAWRSQRLQRVAQPGAATTDAARGCNEWRSQRLH